MEKSQLVFKCPNLVETRGGVVVQSEAVRVLVNNSVTAVYCTKLKDNDPSYRCQKTGKRCSFVHYSGGGI